MAAERNRAAPRLRVMVGVVGLAGHALPALALARTLRERGHELTVHTYERWREVLEELSIAFAGAPEQIVELPGRSDAAAADPATVARALLGSIERFDPDVVVSDAMTLTPGLAAEVAGVPRVTLFPEVFPAHAAGAPPFSLGLRAPRTALGAAMWRVASPLLSTRLPSTRWLRASFTDLNRRRAELGLPPQARINDFSHALNLVATLPQLEYPRRWPPDTFVTGPMSLDLPGPPLRLPPGDDPLVVVAPSTVKDPEGRLARTALEALGDQRVRLLVTTGGQDPALLGPTSQNATVREWIDYSTTIPAAALVICHGNHGTVTRALAEGVPVLISPAVADDAEHGARVAWAGAGLMIPSRLLSPAALRAAALAAIADQRLRERARAIGAWSRAHDGPTRGAELIEAYVSGKDR